jgi:hypothetical protein
MKDWLAGGGEPDDDGAECGLWFDDEPRHATAEEVEQFLEEMRAAEGNL